MRFLENLNDQTVRQWTLRFLSPINQRPAESLSRQQDPTATVQPAVLLGGPMNRILLFKGSQTPCVDCQIVLAQFSRPVSAIP